MMTKTACRMALHACARDLAHEEDTLTRLRFFLNGGRVKHNGIWRELGIKDRSRMVTITIPQSMQRVLVATNRLAKILFESNKLLGDPETMQIQEQGGAYYKSERAKPKKLK